MTLHSGIRKEYPKLFAQAVALGCMVAGLLVLTARGIWPAEALRLHFPLNSLHSLEALAIVLLGGALWLQTRAPFSAFHRKTTVALAALPVFIGLASLVPTSPLAGMLTLACALCLVALGIAAAFPDLEFGKGSRPLQLLLLPVIWTGFLNIVALAYGAVAPNFITSYYVMSIPASCIFLFLAMGFLFARGRTGTMAALTDSKIGGAMARRILPVIVILPFTIGWIRVQGHRWGYYDTYFGFALFATTNISVFTVFIWLTARALNAIDGKREKAMESVQAGNLELTRLNASLEAKIRQHYVAEEARKKAEMQLFQSQKMEALGTLASGIAHDFNNILTIILLNADLAGETVVDGHPARQNLREIGKAGTRAADLIRQIMTFGQRNDSEKKTLRIERVVEDAVNILRRSFPPGIRVTTVVKGVLPAVNANHSHIEQVIINLGANAAHAMGKEAGTLDIRLETVDITPEKASLSAQLREGTYARINVSDSGHGMDAHTLKNIFNPFFTTKAPGEGTGLGLSVVHGIMKLHGGAITVYSEPGRGTVFSLYFPASTSALTQAASSAQASVPAGNGEHVLCVDDDESLVSAVSILLRHLGYTTTVHLYPAQALEDFKSRPGDFDLVLTDFSMPEMSGPALARQLLAMRPELPIVMMSGYVRSEDAEEATLAGIREVLLKPDIPERLSRALYEILTPGRSLQKNAAQGP